MVELFQKDIRTINEHIKNIFAGVELVPQPVIRNFRITLADGAMRVIEEGRQMPRKPAKPKTALSVANFAALVEAIANVHLRTQGAAAKAVNVALTSRNWLIGAYIHEYELKGLDRADYGERLFELLARHLKEIGIPNCNRSRLYRYRDFYRLYPQILEDLPQSQTELIQDLPSDPNIVATASPQSTVPSVATLSPLSGKLILNRLSYSHIELLLEIDDPLKRAFYEIECIQGNWSVRALKRQIATLYYERAGFSDDKEKVAARAHAVAEEVLCTALKI